MGEAVAELHSPSDNCARCLQPVPANAPRCPQCGQPISNARRTVFRVAAVAGVLALVFMLVVMYQVVYLAEIDQAPTLEDAEATPVDTLTAPTATSQEQPPPPKDDKPTAPPEPERVPPLNR